MVRCLGLSMACCVLPWSGFCQTSWVLSHADTLVGLFRYFGFSHTTWICQTSWFSLDILGFWNILIFIRHLKLRFCQTFRVLSNVYELVRHIGCLDMLGFVRYHAHSQISLVLSGTLGVARNLKCHRRLRRCQARTPAKLPAANR